MITTKSTVTKVTKECFFISVGDPAIFPSFFFKLHRRVFIYLTNFDTHGSTKQESMTLITLFNAYFRMFKKMMISSKYVIKRDYLYI